MRLRRVQAWLFAWWLLASACFAGQPLLWVIDGPTPSYLFGTIHIADPTVTTLAPEIEAAWEEADAVYTEVAMDPAAMTALMGQMAAPAGSPPLAERLPPPLRQRLEAALPILAPGMSLEAFTTTDLWAFAIFFAALDIQTFAPPGQPLDMQLWFRAQREGKTTAALETYAEQANVFRGLPEADLLTIIEESLHLFNRPLEERRAEYEALVAAYRTGEVEAMFTLLHAWTAEMGDPAVVDRLLERLLFQRDQRMATRIDALLREEPETVHFFAVGAAHLHPTEGIPAKLAALGRKVRRIEAD